MTYKNGAPLFQDGCGALFIAQTALYYQEMLALKQGESMLAQAEASGKGIHSVYKIKAKGTLYVTNQRLVLEDKKGVIVINLYYDNELSSYKAPKKDKLLLSWHKEGYSGKMEFDIKGTDAFSLESKIGEAVEQVRNTIAATDAAAQVPSQSNNVSAQETALYAPSTKTVQGVAPVSLDMIKDFDTIDPKDFETKYMATNWFYDIEDPVEITRTLIAMMRNYEIDQKNKYDRMSNNIEFLKPYIRKQLGNLVHGSWNYSKEDSVELVWLILRDSAETAFRTVVKFYPDAFKHTNPHTFLDKIATESILLKFSIDWSKIWKDYSYDPLRVKTVEIEGYLIGIAVTHNDSDYVLHPEDYRLWLEESHAPYDLNEGQDVRNELVYAWNEWRHWARRYDRELAKKAKDRIYEKMKKYCEHEYGNKAEYEYYAWLVSTTRRNLELYSAYLEAMVDKGIQPKEPVKPTFPEDELLPPQTMS